MTYSPIDQVELESMFQPHQDCRLASGFRKNHKVPFIDGKVPTWKDQTADEDEILLLNFLGRFYESGSDAPQSIAAEVWYEVGRQERIARERYDARHTPAIQRDKAGLRAFLYSTYGAPVEMKIVAIRRINGRPVVFGQSEYVQTRTIEDYEVDLAVVVVQQGRSFRVEMFPERPSLKSAVETIREWTK